MPFQGVGGIHDPKRKAFILDKAGIDRALTRIAHEILEKNKGAGTWCSSGFNAAG